MSKRTYLTALVACGVGIAVLTVCVLRKPTDVVTLVARFKANAGFDNTEPRTVIRLMTSTDVSLPESQYALYSMGADGLPHLISLLGDENPDVSRDAGTVIRYMGPQALSALISAVESGSGTVRARSLTLMSHIWVETRWCRERAVHDALEDEVPAVREAAVRSLMLLAPRSEELRRPSKVPFQGEDKTLADLFLEATTDKAPAVRIAAAEEVATLVMPDMDRECPKSPWGIPDIGGKRGLLRDKTVVPLLERMMREDPDDKVRYRAAGMMMTIMVIPIGVGDVLMSEAPDEFGDLCNQKWEELYDSDAPEAANARRKLLSVLLGWWNREGRQRYTDQATP